MPHPALPTGRGRVETEPDEDDVPGLVSGSDSSDGEDWEEEVPELEPQREPEPRELGLSQRLQGGDGAPTAAELRDYTAVANGLRSRAPPPPPTPTVRALPPAPARAGARAARALPPAPEREPLPVLPNHVEWPTLVAVRSEGSVWLEQIPRTKAHRALEVGGDVVCRDGQPRKLGLGGGYSTAFQMGTAFIQQPHAANTGTTPRGTLVAVLSESLPPHMVRRPLCPSAPCQSGAEARSLPGCRSGRGAEGRSSIGARSWASSPRTGTSTTARRR